MFDGWLLARAENKERVLPAVHTVSYANGTFTFKDETGQTRAEIEADGVALLAQWKWQQTFQTQLQQGDTVTEDKIAAPSQKTAKQPIPTTPPPASR